MFNRVLQVKMVRKPKEQTPTSITDSESEGKTAIIANTFTLGFHKAVVGVCAYVLLDTIRQVLVASATKS